MMPTLSRNEQNQYDKYAWPGGYPIFYIVADNGVLCPDCANDTRTDLDPTCPDDDQWRVIAAEVNWEDANLQCDNCYKRIPSAYAEKD